MRYTVYAAILAALLPVVASAAGLASGNNFSVITPAEPTQDAGDRYARLVLERAEKFRAHFVKEWLGGELPAGDVRTVISVRFSAVENSGMTLARDNATQKFHNVFLATGADNAAGPMLFHEIVHTVLATKYPTRLPTWLEEGIASRYDSNHLIAVRQQEVNSWVRTGRFPSLAGLLVATDMSSFDDTAYATAESVVAYLLTLEDKATLLRFGQDGQRVGWDAALRIHYRIAGQLKLQRDWQAWLVRSVK